MPELMKLRDIIGDKLSIPPKPPILPISRSTFLNGVKNGRYPKPIRIAQRVVVWRKKDILNFINGMGS